MRPRRSYDRDRIPSFRRYRSIVLVARLTPNKIPVRVELDGCLTICRRPTNLVSLNGSSKDLRAKGLEVSDPTAGNIHLREPDAVCESPQGRFGIEVAAAYYNGDEARDIWSIARGTPERSRRWLKPGVDPQEFARRVPVLHNFTDQLIESIQRTLDEHCRKTYSVPSYFIIDVTHAALTTTQEAPSILDDLWTPSDSPFLGIWLAFSENWSSKVLPFQLA